MGLEERTIAMWPALVGAQLSRNREPHVDFKLQNACHPLVVHMRGEEYPKNDKGSRSKIGDREKEFRNDSFS